MRGLGRVSTKGRMRLVALQRRGVFRTDYQGRTLRDHLSLVRPASRYVKGGCLPRTSPLSRVRRGLACGRNEYRCGLA